MTPTQGGKANKTGNVLEQTITGVCAAHGFEVVMYSEHIKRPENYGDELLLKNVPYTTLYGGRGYTEFLLVSERYNLKTRIECKWQQSAGSVDEKLPYTYISCIEAMPENDVILLVDGDGFRDGAKEWARNAAANRKYIPDDKPEKNVRVMSTVEFLTWTNQTFI